MLTLAVNIKDGPILTRKFEGNFSKNKEAPVEIIETASLIARTGVFDYVGKIFYPHHRIVEIKIMETP